MTRNTNKISVISSINVNPNGGVPKYPINSVKLTVNGVEGDKQRYKTHGGIEWVEELNNRKADMLYSEIDRNTLFEGTAEIEDRSNMNITFLLTDESKEEQFNKMWNEAGINGLKGHRSVGGYRASMYNALPLESVEVLINVMKKLEEN